MADIGCDHGLLSILCSEKCKNVIGVEKSHHSALKAVNATREIPNVDILHGSGLRALLKANARPDTAVLSGMGASLINKIVTECSQFPEHPMTAQATWSNSIADLLGIKRLIIQPSPLQLWHELPLHRVLLSLGWDYSDQHILAMKNHFYLTTCFVRGDSTTVGSTKNCAEVFQRFPMNSKRLVLHADTTSEIEKKIYKRQIDNWYLFLHQQLKSIATNNAKAGEAEEARRHEHQKCSTAAPEDHFNPSGSIAFKTQRDEFYDEIFTEIEKEAKMPKSG